MSLLDALRDEARLAPESGIVAVRNHGWQKPGIIPLWVGEGDAPTPEFISRPAAEALANGETFYTYQRGIPALRGSLAAYYGRHFGRAFDPSEFIVTGGGMHAILMSMQAVAGKGDEIVYLAPAWPNFAGAALVAGAKPVPVDLDFTANGWSLEPGKVAKAITPATKALFINSPSNPTGWTADRETLVELLALARKHGLWIVADEIYALFHYEGGRAPSFLDIMEPEDRIIFVNTFSKNWSMTGWRIGWLKIHPELQQVFENLMQYSTSGVAQFMQRGAVAALDHGDDYVDAQVDRARKARDIACDIIGGTGKARLVPPAGAFYLFFGVEGVTNSLQAAFDLIDEANIGLAPGTAFGDSGEGFFRLCFNRRLDQVEEAATRVAGWINSR